MLLPYKIFVYRPPVRALHSMLIQSQHTSFCPSTLIPHKNGWPTVKKGAGRDMAIEENYRRLLLGFSRLIGDTTVTRLAREGFQARE